MSKNLTVSDFRTNLIQVGAICESLAECDEEECPLYQVCVEHKPMRELMPKFTETDALAAESLFFYRGDCEVSRDVQGGLHCGDDDLPAELFKPLKPGESCLLSDLRYF